MSGAACPGESFPRNGIIARRTRGDYMTVLGHVKNGVVVVDGPVILPEGAVVRLEVVGSAAPQVAENGSDETLREKFLKYAGKASGLPRDLARNHDHYIHGTPKE
jgi:hypothetical protein